MGISTAFDRRGNIILLNEIFTILLKLQLSQGNGVKRKTLPSQIFLAGRLISVEGNIFLCVCSFRQLKETVTAS